MALQDGDTAVPEISEAENPLPRNCGRGHDADPYAISDIGRLSAGESHGIIAAARPFDHKLTIVLALKRTIEHDFLHEELIFVQWFAGSYSDLEIFTILHFLFKICQCLVVGKQRFRLPRRTDWDSPVIIL
jgi:hypothetical protein